jgi:hypothetical protein
VRPEQHLWKQRLPALPREPLRGQAALRALRLEQSPPRRYSLRQMPRAPPPELQQLAAQRELELERDSRPARGLRLVQGWRQALKPRPQGHFRQPARGEQRVLRALASQPAARELPPALALLPQAWAEVSVGLRLPPHSSPTPLRPPSPAWPTPPIPESRRLAAASPIRSNLFDSRRFDWPRDARGAARGV